MRLGYLGVDQYGRTYRISKHPRKELMEQLGSSSAKKMYNGLNDGSSRHAGYIVSGLWIDVHEVHSWSGREVTA